MKFEISQALLFERTIVVSMTIVLFGLLSIGGLWLLRRAIEKHSAAGSPAGDASNIESRDALVRAIESLADSLKRSPQASMSRESMTNPTHR